MTNDDELFARLEREVGELPPDCVVEYHGRMTKCHGLYVVHAQLGDDRYHLYRVDHPYVRLNARRDELSKIYE